MASSITTTGTTTDPVTTTRQPGESTSDWVTRHNGNVANATPSGDKLTTTWKSAGGPQTRTTNRKAGESDGVFQGRHIIEYTTDMIEDPPI
jgi:hypothetical protein